MEKTYSTIDPYGSIVDPFGLIYIMWGELLKFEKF